MNTGVGDLYTDPQMHTVDQKDYGEANLETRGMALFFSSHICNPICLAMGECARWMPALCWWCRA